MQEITANAMDDVKQEKPDDFVIATGVQFSVRQFILWSAMELGISLEFKGSGLDEVGIVTGVSGNNSPAISEGDVIVRIDPNYFRPAEVETLLGDPSKAKRFWVGLLKLQQNKCALKWSQKI